MSGAGSQEGDLPAEGRETAGHGKPQWFTTTHWTVVQEAGQNSASALEQLCRTYWPPLYAWLRRNGYDYHDASDRVQGFFQHLLEHKTVAAAVPEKGRFRNYLLVAMKYYLSHELERAGAAKRGGGFKFVSLDELTEEERDYQGPANPSQAERDYDRRWALKVLERAQANLRKDFAAIGKESTFEALQIYLSDVDACSHSEMAERLQMSPGAVKVAVHRLRGRFADLVRDELAQTVSSPSELKDELRHLKAALCG